MKGYIAAITIFIYLFSPARTFAWGERGHNIIAEIAFKFLDEGTKKNVLYYLNGMTFQDAANWMDKMRSDHAYDFMKPYHYADFEKGEPAGEISGDNIIGVLEVTLKELENRSRLADKDVRTRLFYLFHLIGDLHQPLHIGYAEDKGGNTVQISLFGNGTNLHKLWDSDIIEYKHLTLEDCLRLNQYSGQELAKIQKIDILSWANESRGFLGQVYGFEGHKIDDAYINTAYPIIERQILNAGLRLAAILCKYFKPRLDIDGPIPSSKIINDSIPEINISRAKDYEGRIVKICSRVYGTKFLESSNRQPTFLNLGADYPNSPLTIVIFGDSRTNFKNKPEEYYKGKNICVRGKISMYREKPEIIVDNQAEIQILP